MFRFKKLGCGTQDVCYFDIQMEIQFLIEECLIPLEVIYILSTIGPTLIISRKNSRQYVQQMKIPNCDWMVFFKSVFMLSVARHAKYFIAKNVAR